MFRIIRCDRMERKLRDLASFRAINLWEEDQRLAAENLAVKLARQPARVVAQLRQTPAGIEHDETAGAEQPLEAAIAHEKRPPVVLDDHLETEQHDTSLQ